MDVWMWFLALVIAIAACDAASAQNENELEQMEAVGFVGAGVAAIPDYVGSDSFEPTPALFGRYQWADGRYVSLGGAVGAGQAARLQANVIPARIGRGWMAGPLAQLRGERDDVEDNRVDRLEAIDRAGELGGFVGFRTRQWEFTVAGAADVTNAHDGYVIDVETAYRLSMEQWTHRFSAGFAYADEDFMDTYFSVSPTGAIRSGLDEFEADDGIGAVSVGFNSNYDLAGAWGLMVFARYARLLGDAADSPIVDGAGSENQITGGLAVTLTW